MFLNIYYDTKPTVQSFKFGIFDIGCGGSCFWIISSEKDKNAMHILKYNNEKWLVYFQGYDKDTIDPNSNFAKFIKEFEITLDLHEDKNERFAFAYVKSPWPLFGKMEHEFDNGDFFLIKLKNKFSSPGYLWETNGRYDKSIYGDNKANNYWEEDTEEKEEDTEEKKEKINHPFLTELQKLNYNVKQFDEGPSGEYYVFYQEEPDDPDYSSKHRYSKNYKWMMTNVDKINLDSLLSSLGCGGHYNNIRIFHNEKDITRESNFKAIDLDPERLIYDD